MALFRFHVAASHGFEVPSVYYSSWFAAKTFKGVLRHLGTVHAVEAGFFVRCSLHGCSRTYRNFHSYKKHIYMKHREILEISASELDTESQVLLSSPGNVTPSHCPESDDATSEACTSGKREAALFVLRAKHVHKVAQSSLNGIMCDYTSMLESTLHSLETGVMAALGNKRRVSIKRRVKRKGVAMSTWCDSCSIASA